MHFENLQIDVANLPSTEGLQYESLEEDYLKVKIINHIIFFLILFGPLILFIKLNDNIDWRYGGLLIFGWLLLGIGTGIYKIKAFNFKKFALRSKDVIYRSGLIWKKNVIIPFNRIQHCELNQGPIEKRFNLAELKIFTAGGQSSDMRIPGLRFERANQIKEYLVNQINEEPTV